jgi:hypothetical protein
MNRISLLIISGITGFISACSEPDSICDCITASAAVNKKSAEILKKEPTAADESTLKKLRAEKKKKCAAFEDMSGPEMLERKATCND